MDKETQHGKNVQELLSLLKKDKSLSDFRNAFGNPEDLEEFATRARFVTYDQGAKIVEQGESGSDIFLIISGQLRAVDVSAAEPRLLGYMTTGAFVGARALLLGHKTRTATVEVVTNTATVAFFNEEDWYWLMGKNSRFEDYFENLESSRVQRSGIDFPGRQWDEVVVASTKRHFLAFIASLPLPLTLLTAPLLFFLAAEISGLEFLTIVTDNLTLLATLPFIILAIGLTIYNYFDWRNDDLIVTTKRVVHIERMILFGEQRRDAPLTRIQDVTLVSDLLDVLFDSDNLRITTAGVGVLEINHIRRADHIRQVIFEERERAKARVAAADVAALRQNIAQQLDWEDELDRNVMAVAEAEGKLTRHSTTQHYNRFIDYFIPRVKEVNETDDGTIIIWRKHYYVLLTHILLPTLALLGSVYLFIASFILWIPPFGAPVAIPVQIGLGLMILGSLVWYVWQYDDWIKDVYIVTNTQIIDIESAAFRLRRSRREGTFDNIQGVYSEVPNIFYKILNLGDVIIETAGSEETFTFKKVFNPTAVNEEIFNRWAVYQQRERESSRDSTHRQVMEVLKEYHRLATKVQD